MTQCEFRAMCNIPERCLLARRCLGGGFFCGIVWRSSHSAPCGADAVSSARELAIFVTQPLVELR